MVAAGILALAVQGLSLRGPRPAVAALPPSASPSPSPSAEPSLSPSPSPTAATPTASTLPTPQPCPTVTPSASTPAPAPRIGAAMTYDAALGKLLLFSGVRGDESCQAASTWILQDSWTWDGTAWEQLHPASLPPGRSFGSMGYDAARRSTLLFGGGAPNSDPTRLDTWTWASKTWSQQHPSLAPAGEGLMTYDPDTGSLLLLSSSTYSWDGRTWIDLHPAHPYPSA